MMYVYFDEAGDIKSISPVVDDTLEGLRSAEFSDAHVIDFLTGTKNVHQHAVVIDKDTGDFKFVSKETETEKLSTLNMYLSEVTDEFHDKHDIMIEHDVRQKHLRITLSGTGNSKEETLKNKTLIANQRKLSFYFTFYGDPNMLICSFDVDVTELIAGDVYVNLEHRGDELNNATLFTKQILGKYHHRKLQYT